MVLTATDTDTLAIGDKIPRIVVPPRYKGGGKHALGIQFNLEGSYTAFYSFSNSVPLNNWTSISISLSKDHVGGQYRYSMKLDNAEFASEIISKPRSFSNVKVYASSPWESAAPGQIRNLVIDPGKLIKARSTSFLLFFKLVVIAEIKLTFALQDIYLILHSSFRA